MPPATRDSPASAGDGVDRIEAESHSSSSSSPTASSPHHTSSSSSPVVDASLFDLDPAGEEPPTGSASVTEGKGKKSRSKHERGGGGGGGGAGSKTSAADSAAALLELQRRIDALESANAALSDVAVVKCTQGCDRVATMHCTTCFGLCDAHCASLHQVPAWQSHTTMPMSLKAEYEAAQRKAQIEACAAELRTRINAVQDEKATAKAQLLDQARIDLRDREMEGLAQPRAAIDSLLDEAKHLHKEWSADLDAFDTTRKDLDKRRERIHEDAKTELAETAALLALPPERVVLEGAKIDALSADALRQQCTDFTTAWWAQRPVVPNTEASELSTLLKLSDVRSILTLAQLSYLVHALVLQGVVVKRAQRLYKASAPVEGQGGWKAEDMLSKIAEKGSTLTVIRTDAGHVFGWYSAVAWNRRPAPGAKGVNTADATMKTFAFSLANGHAAPFMLTLKDPARAIRVSPDHGPAFGGVVEDEAGNVTHHPLVVLMDGDASKAANEPEANRCHACDPAVYATVPLTDGGLSWVPEVGATTLAGAEMWAAKDVEVFLV